MSDLTAVALAILTVRHGASSAEFLRDEGMTPWTSAMNEAAAAAAQVRAQVAAEIEAQGRAWTEALDERRSTNPAWQYGAMSREIAYRHAARIARGESS